MTFRKRRWRGKEEIVTLNDMKSLLTQFKSSCFTNLTLNTCWWQTTLGNMIWIWNSDFIQKNMEILEQTVCNVWINLNAFAFGLSAHREKRFAWNVARLSLSEATLLSNSIAANEINVACMLTLSSDGLTCFEHHEERTRSINREGFLK